jgi:hypothetical protein
VAAAAGRAATAETAIRGRKRESRFMGWMTCRC